MGQTRRPHRGSPLTEAVARRLEDADCTPEEAASVAEQLYAEYVEAVEHDSEVDLTTDTMLGILDVVRDIAKRPPEEQG